MQWHDPRLLISGLTAGGLFLSLAAVAPWLVAAKISWRIMRRDISPLPTVLAVVLGAVCFVPAISWIQVPWQQAASRYLNETVASTSPLLLMGPVIWISGLVQEPVKWLAAVVALAVGRFRTWGNRRRMAIAFSLAGLAFGWAEAWVILSLASQGFWGPALLERLLTVGFHAGATGLVGWFWAGGSGRGLAALAVVSAYHGLLNTAIIMPVIGLPTGLVWLVLASAGLAAPAALAMLIGRELRICER